MFQKLKILFFIVFLGSLFFPLISLAFVNSYESDGKTIYYKGLVPCGGLRTDSEGNPYGRRAIPPDRKIPSGYVAISDTEMAEATPHCQLCHFFVMFDGIIDFLLFKIIPPLAALMIAIGGFMYIFAYAGGVEKGPEMTSQAKRLFTAVAIGLLIIYGAFIIIGTFLQFIGLAEWTTDIYYRWWEKGIFEIPCP